MVFFVVYIVLGYMGYKEGCSNFQIFGSFSSRGGEALFAPVTTYLGGASCSNSLLYILNIPIQLLMAVITVFVLEWDRVGMKKREEEAGPYATSHVTDILIPLVYPISFIVGAVLYFNVRDNLYEQGYLVILGVMLTTLILRIIIMIPYRDNPHYGIYYFFKPTTFVKVGIVLAIVFTIFTYYQTQCINRSPETMGYLCPGR